jgi:hypothetical protein
MGSHRGFNQYVGELHGYGKKTNQYLWLTELRSKVVATFWRSIKDDRTKVGGLRDATAMLPTGMIRWSIGFKIGVGDYRQLVTRHARSIK